MASVTFPTNLGGSGQTISDDADPNTGLANGGHRLRFVPALQGTVDMAQYVYQHAAKIDRAADDADRAENARGYVEAIADAYQVNIKDAYRDKWTLDLNFARGKYLVDDGDLTETTDANDLLTVERATPKWVFGPNGKLREVPPNTIARQWNPETGEPEGVLIEESRTNLLLWSEDFTQGVWAPQITGIGVEEYPGGSPAASAYLVRAEQSFQSSLVEVRQSGLSINEGPLSMFLLCKPLGEVNGVGFLTSGNRKSNQNPVFDFRDKTISVGSGNIVELNDGWFLCEMTNVATSSGGEFFGFRPAKDGQVSISANEGEELMLVSLAQYEQASTPSSYIPTTDAPATRAADDVYRTLGGEYNPYEGTVLIECDVEGIRRSSGAFATAIASWGEPNRDNTFVVYTSGEGRPQLSMRIYGSVGLQVFTLGEKVLNEVVSGRLKIAASYNVSTGEVAISTLGQVESRTWDFEGYSQNDAEFLLNKLGRKNEFDHSSSSQLYGDVRYIPQALSEAELVELTK